MEIDYTPIKVTDKAAREVIRIIKENKLDAETALRVKIVGGGCAGFSYMLHIEDKKTKNDLEIVTNGITIYVDSMSKMYLVGENGGTTLDYVEDELLGAGFKFDNPNIATSCGCGKSFNT